MDEEWNYPGNNPIWQTNYLCRMNKDGLWRIESERYNKRIGGKWLFNIELKPGAFNYPTMADQNNFMSGLLEADWNNDVFKFPDGSTRCSSFGKEPTAEFKKRLKILQEVLDFYKNKYSGQRTIGDFQDD